MKHERFHEGWNRYAQGRPHERYPRSYTDDRCVHHEHNYLPYGPHDGYYRYENSFDHRNCEFAPYRFYNDGYETNFPEYPHSYPHYREYIPQPTRNYWSYDGSCWSEEPIHPSRAHLIRQREHHLRRPVKVLNNYKRSNRIEGLSKRDNDDTPVSTISSKSIKPPTLNTKRISRQETYQFDNLISISSSTSSNMNNTTTNTTTSSNRDNTNAGKKMHLMKKVDKSSKASDGSTKMTGSKRHTHRNSNRVKQIEHTNNAAKKLIKNESKILKNQVNDDEDNNTMNNNNNINNNTMNNTNKNKIKKINKINNFDVNRPIDVENYINKVVNDYNINNDIKDNIINKNYNNNNIDINSISNVNNNINNIKSINNNNKNNIIINNKYIKDEDENGNAVIIQRRTRRGGGRHKAKIITGRPIHNKLLDSSGSKLSDINAVNENNNTNTNNTNNNDNKEYNINNNTMINSNTTNNKQYNNNNNDDNINNNASNEIYNDDETMSTGSDYSPKIVLRKSTLRPRINRNSPLINTPDRVKNSISQKESIESNDMEKALIGRKPRRKMIKNENLLSDIININKMTTRNAENFYQSQLKLAIEMSMRDVDRNNENQDISTGCTTERIMEVLSDLESELGEEKPKKKIQKVTETNKEEKKTKASKPTGLKRGPKPKKKNEEVLNSNSYLNENINTTNDAKDNRDNNSSSTNKTSTTTKKNKKMNNDIDIDKSYDINNYNFGINSSNNINNTVNTDINNMNKNTNNTHDINKSMSDELSETNLQIQPYNNSNGLMNLTEISKETDEQMINKLKIKSFEEYLSIAERLYCGKTLVEHIMNNNCINRRPKPNIRTNSLEYKNKVGDKENNNNNNTNRDNSNTKDTNNINNNTRDSGVSNSSSTNKTSTTTQSNNSKESKDVKEKENKEGILTSLDIKQLNLRHNQDTEEILKFNCSRLDLVYRVSFNILKSPLRQPEIIDLWGPKELILFELGLFKYGKVFHEIQREIPSKSVKEIVDMYYLWKKTNRYKVWKENRYYQIDTIDG